MNKNMIFIFIFTSLLNADVNIVRDKDLMKQQLIKISGKTSRYNHAESFPHDYFLIPKNLPYAFKIVLYHPESSQLGLSKKKIQAFVDLKKKTKPIVLKKAKMIKNLELSLVSLIEKHSGEVKLTDDMNRLINKIAIEKAKLSKIHINCILNVQSLLTEEEKKKINLLINKDDS